ncbi:glycosyl hydrolase catalytic core-domain-containing protein [Sparassis latifolia]
MAAYRLALLLIILVSFPRHAVARSSSKAGLAWPNGPYVDMNQFMITSRAQCSVGYQTLEFVPMLWRESQVSDWERSINNTISYQHVTHALGFNEPEQSEPLKAQGILIGTPAPSSAPVGKQWLLQWLDACQGGCTVDFVALHWYDINSMPFVVYLEDFYETFQRPIWVTEWACQNYNQADNQCSLQDIVTFMDATQAFMDDMQWVERYAWFGAIENMQGVNADNALITSSGNINIGSIVPNVSSNHRPSDVYVSQMQYI